jgi:two-component system response regulator HydG
LPSELFGHERGAFTGAVERKAGRLACAEGGTLFLDEVGDLSLDGQAMLLRFLERGEIQPVGSPRTRRVDVRVIAATHRQLEWAVERETFRGDLYYRLCPWALEVPALRARREDIPLLVEHVRVETNARCGVAIEGVTPEALDRLQRLPWPGNVRELEGVVRRTMILRGEGWIRPEDLRVAAGGRAAKPGQRRSGRLTWLQREALRLAREWSELRRADFMACCGISRKVAGRELGRLVRAGVLRRVGQGRGARYVPTT